MATEEFDINTMRRGLAAAGVVALITAGAAACGDEQPSTPQGKVTKAFTTLGEQKSVTIGLSFDGTAQQIHDGMNDGSDDSDFTLSDAKILAGLHVTAGYSADKPLAELKASGKDDTQASVEVTSGDSKDAKPLIGVRSVGKTMYAQVDIKGITALDPESSDLSDINDLLDSVDEMPSSFASIKALAHGRWISLDPKAFADFAKTLGAGDDEGGSDSSDDSGLGALGLPSGLPTGLPTDLANKTFAQLLAPLQASLTKDAKLTDLGTKDGADRIRASIAAPKLVKDLQAAIGSLSKNLPGDVTKGLDDVPNKTVNLELALKGGELSGITVDLAQLDDTTHHGSLPLTLSVDGGADKVEAPKGAVKLNPQDLTGFFMQQFGVKADKLDPSAFSYGSDPAAGVGSGSVKPKAWETTEG